MKRKPIDPTAMPAERLLWTAGVVLGASVLHWPELPIWMPVLLCGCILWRFAAKFAGWPLPNSWVRLALAFVAFTAVLFEYGTINGVKAGSALLVVMVALKFFECHTQRDQLVLMIIAYFLVFASLLYGGGLVKGAYLLAFVWITTVGLLQLGRDGHLLPSWPTARLAGRLLLQAVPIMLVLFVLFPRLPGPLWAIPGSTSSGASGLSGEMSPGDITNLGLSDEVAFRAEFIGPAPSPADLYWRGPVLSNFDGRTWTRAVGMRRQVNNSIDYVGDSSEYRVMLEPNGQSWIFALDMPERWSTNSRRMNVVMGSDYQLRLFTMDPPVGGVEYSVTSYSRYRALEPLSEAEQAMFTRLPEGSNPQTRELVAGWLEDDPTPRQIIAQALDVFRGDEFFYTLTPPALGRHTADEFIFTTHEGFCEHYASAFTIMLRAAGLPARVVTGYQGGELNPLAEYYIVRQSDAHAWTEVWLEGEGWVRVDPITAVAPDRIALGSMRSAMGATAAGTSALRPMALARQLLLAWDTVNTYWNRWVIGYGPRLQRSLLEWLGMDRPRLGKLLLLTFAATIGLMALLSMYLTLRFRRERHRDSAALSFRAFHRKLRKLDVAPPEPGEMPSDYARRAARQLPHASAAIDDVVASYLKARYEPDADRHELRRLQQLVRDFSAGCAPA